jgi:hypothetical protein
MMARTVSAPGSLQTALAALHFRRRGHIPQRHGWKQKPPVQGGEAAVNIGNIARRADAEMAVF